MAAGLSLLVHVATGVARMLSVEVLTVRLESDPLWALGYADAVPGVDVDIHAATYDDAEQLALRWGLTERQPWFSKSAAYGCELRWRVWSSWAPELCSTAAVWVSVTAAEPSPGCEVTVAPEWVEEEVSA